MPRLFALAAAAAAAVLAVASCGPPADTLRYDFDDGLATGDRGGYIDGDRFDGQIRLAGGARVEVVVGRGEEGKALRFPAVCRGTTCPQAIVEIPDSAELDPKEAPFSYGAAVLLARAELTGGSNVVQKGAFGDPTGQWKLQVDKMDGRPSCVVQGQRRGQHTRAVVVADVGVADGRWHAVSCTKRESYVAITVDGKQRGREDVRIGAVANDAPVRVGGKAILDRGDNDQFHGALDDVFLRVESR